MTIKPTYTYNARVKEIHDGDTLTVDWDMGADIFRVNQKLRLYKVNTPELYTIVGGVKTRSDAGFAARDALVKLITLSPVTVRTVYGVPSLLLTVPAPVVMTTVLDKTEKYGRYLATLYVTQGTVQVCVNTWLVTNGFAVVM